MPHHEGYDRFSHFEMTYNWRPDRNSELLQGCHRVETQISYHLRTLGRISLHDIWILRNIAFEHDDPSAIVGSRPRSRHSP